MSDKKQERKVESEMTYDEFSIMTRRVRKHGLVGIEAVTKERVEQVVKHGYTIERDNLNNVPSDLQNAAVYALTLDDEFYPDHWEDWMKDRLKEKGIQERRAIAGAWCAGAIALQEYINSFPAINK